MTDSLYQKNGLRKTSTTLLKACVSDDLETARTANEIYKRVEAVEKAQEKADARHDLEIVLKEFERFVNGMVVKGDESRAQLEARAWTVRKDVWEKYSVLTRILETS